MRALLPNAVLARPTDDTVDLQAWVCIAEALEASANVIACHGDGGQQDGRHRFT